MEAPPPLPRKKDILEKLLGDSNVFIHLDPRKRGVVVPKWFQNQPELILQLGLQMLVPIPDLEVDEEGVSCTLSFSRAPFWCCIPWTSVFALISEKDKRGVVWPEDVPPDGQAARSLKPPPAKRPKLTALGPNDRLESSPPPPLAEEQATPAIGPDAKCRSCGTPWVEDASSCPLCGASAAEALASSPKEPTGDAVSPPLPDVPASPSVSARPTLVARPPESERANGKKRGPAKRKRQDDAQTTLASVPASEEAPPPPRSENPPPSSSDTSTGETASPKRAPKRELPPYLRVVK
jgi:hypothetical protein